MSAPEPRPIPSVFPPVHAWNLMKAAETGDLKRIDQITDDLVALGKCRPRNDASMFTVRRHQQGAEL